MTSPSERALTPFEEAHARSILDAEPEVVPIPPARVPRILVATVVRKPPAVVAAWLRTIRWQQLRDPISLDLWVTLDTQGEPYHGEVVKLVQSGVDHVEVASPSDGYADYGDTGTTRQWSPKAWHRVGALKNAILAHAVREGYDAVWLVDADVLCDPWTLQSLLDAQAPVTSAVYWTFWTKRRPEDAIHQQCGPQVWLRHPYVLDGRGWTAPDFRRALVDRQRVRVWGLGACTLIQRDPLLKGLDFRPVGTLPAGPMADGEDRHFCWRADALHVLLYADAWPDVWHCYHPEQRDEIPQMLERLARDHSERPRLGDLISARVTNLEAPVAGTQWLRGRLGAMKLHPEVEQILASLRVGETAVRKIHFPVHWPEAQLRNKSCVLRFELLDAKPFAVAPTIDQETLVGSTGGVIDPTTLTADQLGEVLAEASAQ